MIKANELRIGNWVMDDAPACPVYRKIDADLIKYIEINGEGTMSAIRLSPEILEKAGFEGFDNKKEWFVTGCRLWVIDGDFIYDTKASKVTVIKSVHQLQNLIFALTGTELEIKLNT